jgi:hypothetical protein
MGRTAFSEWLSAHATPEQIATLAGGLEGVRLSRSR